MTSQTASAPPTIKLNYVILPVLGAAIYFYLNLFANALTDDAFITLRYVKTLLETGTWGFVPGYVANAVTSPLNIFLLAFLGIFLGATINTVTWLSALLLTLTALFLGRISFHLFRTESFGYLAAGALIFNPLLVSTLGLESMLFVTLYTLSTYLYLTKRWSWLAVTLGLMTLTRFDGIVFFVVTWLLVPTVRLRTRFAAIYGLSAVPWYIFSWIYFGSVFPDTLFIKIAQRSWGAWDFLNGIHLYFQVYTLEAILSLFLLPLLLLLYYSEVRHASIIGFLLLTSIAHFASYSILRIPPYYWYYVPEITAITLAGSLALGILFQQHRPGTWNRKGLQSIAATLLILQAAGMFYSLARNSFPIKEMPIHTNWATHEEYKTIAEWLKETSRGSIILVDGEVGTLGYYCDCYLSSFFSDRRWLEQYVRKQTTGNGLKQFLHRINFFFFNMEVNFPQPDYFLAEIPDGDDSRTEAIKEWKTKTKWIAICVVKLTDYPP